MNAQQGASLSLAVTTVIVAAKVAAGWMTGAISVWAEALQSTVDIAVALGVVLSIRWAAKPADDDHPYGHGKAEVIMSALQMVLLMLSAGYIFAKALERLRTPEVIAPNVGIFVMLGAGLVNVLLAAYLWRISVREQSLALRGEATHLLSDAAAAGGVGLGLVLVLLTGNSAIDPWIAILFALGVIGFALRRFSNLLHPLMDGALSAEDRERIERCLATHPKVKGFHNLRTRQVGSQKIVEFHLLLDDDFSFVQAHAEAEDVEEAIRQELGGALVTVHYEPYAAEMAHQRKAHQGPTRA